MSTSYLIDGGTLKVNLQWHSAVNRNYMLENGGWAPQVSDLAARPLSGRGPYEEIVEDRLVTIHGRSTDEVLGNLDTLYRLMDQAETFARGETAAPVLIKYQPNLSTHWHEARILKRLPGDGPRVTVPPNFNEQAQRGYIEHVRLRYRRSIFIEPAGIENFAQNWSFEDVGTSGAPALTYWTAHNAPTLTFDDTTGILNPTHGSIVLLIEGGAAGTERGIFQDITGLTVGQVYTVSVDINWLSGTMRLRATDGGGALNPVNATVTSGSGWQRISLVKTCPAGGSIRVWLLSDSAAPGNAWFDAVMLAITSTVVADVDINQSVSRIAGEPQICNLADHVAPSPIKAEILMCDASGVEVGTTFNHWPSFLILTNNNKNLRVFGANTMATSLGTWTKPAAAVADQSYTGTLLRYTPAATTPSKDPQIGINFWNNIPVFSKLLGVRVVVFLVCRASLANNFTVRGYISDDTGSHNFEVASEPVVIESTATTIVPLIFPAPLRLTRFFGSFCLQLEATAATAAGTIDFDRVTVANVTPGEDTKIVRLNESLLQSTASVIGGRLVLDVGSNTRRQPFVGIVNSSPTSGEQVFSSDGDLEVYMRGPEVAGLWLAIGDARGATLGTYWQYYDSTNSFVVRNRLRITRRKARVSPR